MAILFIRTIIVYSLAIVALRLMGKRQIGELQPSELVVAIMISDLATMPMSDVSIPLAYGIVPIFTLVICEVLLSFISLKSEKLRVILSGKPQILIKDGKIEREELLHARVNIDDLMEELRKVGYFSLSDVDTVILETGGSISVIPTKDAAGPSNKDLSINACQQKVPYIFVSDGKIRQSELDRAGKSKAWLIKQLEKNDISSPNEVFVFSLDAQGDFYTQKKDD